MEPGTEASASGSGANMVEAIVSFWPLVLIIAIAALLWPFRKPLANLITREAADDRVSPANVPEVRDRIARYVVWFFGGGLLLVSLVIAVTGANVAQQPEQKISVLMQVFTAIIGVVGTWVGTVLAFYYSKDNFEAASQQSRALAEQLSPDRLRTLSVERVMIRRSAIKTLSVQTGRDEDVAVNKVKEAISGVSRLVVVNANDSVRYIIHESLVYRDIVQRGGKKRDNAGQDVDRTLADLLKDDVDIGRAALLIAFVDAGGTLADAKAAMEKVVGARDVIVTTGADSAKPVLGWITNNIIVENSRA